MSPRRGSSGFGGCRCLRTGLLRRLRCAIAAFAVVGIRVFLLVVSWHFDFDSEFDFDARLVLNRLEKRHDYC